MSAQLSMPEPETTALAIIPAASLPTLIAADQTDILGKLRKELAGYTPDASTEPGRKEIGQKVRRIGVAKMDFKRLKEGLLEDAKKQVASVNAEYKVIETNCDALRDAIDGALEDYKKIERDRVAAHEAALEALDAATNVIPGEPSEAIRAKLRAFLSIPPRDWQEFARRAADAMDAGQRHLEGLIVTTEKREAEAAELVRLRAEAEERARLDAIRIQQEREAEIARRAAEHARMEAEAAAERERQEVLRAAAEERAKVEQAAEAERQRAQAEIERADRERQAAEDRARQAVSDALAAAQRAEAAAKQAEADRLAAAERAEQETVAAVAAEQRRAAAVIAAAEAEAAKRAANVAHKRRINSEVLDDIMQVMSEHHSGSAGEANAIAKAIITAIAKGDVRHISIGY